jgi:hypothetical protein
MESFEALERIDVDRVYAEAEQLLAAGELEALDSFLHTLESKRQHYLDVEKQATATVRQLEQRFAALRAELAYDPGLVEQYREAQLVLDMQISRLQAGRKEAETIAGILVKLRPQVERFTGRRKAIELAVRAQEIRNELHQLKLTLLPAFEHIIEKVATLQRDAVAFNRTAAVAHLPQTQFLQCRVDLTQLLAALAELDVVVVPEMEQLATLQSQPSTENSRHTPEFPQDFFANPGPSPRLHPELERKT